MPGQILRYLLEHHSKVAQNWIVVVVFEARRFKEGALFVRTNRTVQLGPGKHHAEMKRIA